MSHELRTPLNTVMGFSKLLSEHDKRKLADADIVQYASLIHDSASHLLAVINDILDISKMRSGNYSLETQEADLAEILRGRINDARTAAEAAGINIRSRVSFELPPVRGDEGKLSQIFANVLSNAIKFNRPQGDIMVDAAEHGADSIMVSIRDTGIGMTDDEIRIALEPFGQVDGGRTRWREGAGLGLPIAKALVELHGGKFMITSVKGSGTDVTVILPCSHMVSLAEARDAVFGQGASL
jgi:two-component system cell cycle sensor histidine kinase PleC